MSGLLLLGMLKASHDLEGKLLKVKGNSTLNYVHLCFLKKQKWILAHLTLVSLILMSRELLLFLPSDIFLVLTPSWKGIPRMSLMGVVSA